VRNLSASPGVYRMLDEQGQVLYVGKARTCANAWQVIFRATGLADYTTHGCAPSPPST